MAMTDSRLAFTDCYELMEKAIEDPKGIRIKFACEEDAWLYRLRMHTARRIDRRENAGNYEKGHRMHGKSVYDELVMRLKQVKDGNGSWWLRMERLSIDGLQIESLTNADEEEEIKPPKVPLEALSIPAIVKVQPLLKRRL